MNTQEIITIIAIICGIIGTLGGAALGAWLNSKYSLRGIKRQEFNRASSNFREVFVDFLRELEIKIPDKNFGESDNVNWTMHELDRLESCHEKAAIRFRQYLSNSQRRAFNIAWKDYLYPNKHGYLDSPRTDYFSSNDPEKETEIRQTVYDKLLKILEFAKF